MQTHTEIKEFIVSEFIPGGKSSDVPDDLNLIDTGVIDSLGVLNLISTLETDFDIRIEPEDMDPVNFATVDKIHTFIQSRLPRAN